LAAGGFHLSTNAINTVGVISCKKGRRYFRISATQSPQKKFKIRRNFVKKGRLVRTVFLFSQFSFSFSLFRDVPE
jgi:hypothetical protein